MADYLGVEKNPYAVIYCAEKEILDDLASLQMGMDSFDMDCFES